MCEGMATDMRIFHPPESEPIAQPCISSVNSSSSSCFFFSSALRCASCLSALIHSSTVSVASLPSMSWSTKHVLMSCGNSSSCLFAIARMSVDLPQPLWPHTP